MNTIDVECLNCSATHKFAEDRAGHTVECPDCGQGVELSPTIVISLAQIALSGIVARTPFSCPCCGDRQQERSASQCSSCHVNYRRGFCAACGDRRLKNCGCAHRPVVWGTAADPLCTHCGQTFRGHGAVATALIKVEAWLISKLPMLFAAKDIPEQRRCPRCATELFLLSKPYSKLSKLSRAENDFIDAAIRAVIDDYDVEDLKKTIPEAKRDITDGQRNLDDQAQGEIRRSDSERSGDLRKFSQTAFKVFGICHTVWAIRVIKTGDRIHDDHHDKILWRIGQLGRDAISLIEYCNKRGAGGGRGAS